MSPVKTTLVSPDGALRLLVLVHDDDTVLGFDGHPWHTHADILQGTYQGGPTEAVKRWIADLVGGKLVIAVSRLGDAILDVWVADDPAAVAADRFRPADESVEFRLWDGTRVRP